jgi:predicted dehydrogenase
MQHLDRRSFLKQSLVASASLAVLPAWKLAAQTSAVSQARVAGANDAIRIGVVGFGGRGKDHIENYRKLPGVRLAAFCDVDRDILDRELRKSKEKGEDAQGFTDIRDMLEHCKLDAVSIATPNHWHSLGAIWAVQSGKDVYVEKPVSHNVFEGGQLAAAARKHHCIVQVGTQSRSSPGLREAVAWLQAGNHGKILRARGLCYKPRGSIGKTSGDQPVPKSVDYNLWLGPAPMKQPHRKRFHYDWHWFWDTGNGDLGNQGVHQMDIARWVLGVNELSPAVLAVGGRLGYEDDAETPNTMIMFHDYQPAPLLFEVRGLPAKADGKSMDKFHGASVGVIVDCEGGSVTIPSYSRAIIHDKDGKEIRKFEGGGSHYENFLKAMRSRKPADLHAEAMEGHLSAALCHTSNISYRLGKPGSPEANRDAVKNNKDLAEMLGRMEEHWAANNVDLAKTPAVLGQALRMNPKTEKFVDNKAADALLTREYRKPFVVPAKI